MIEPLKVFYYNTFLPVKFGEGILSRQFLAAANQLNQWCLITVPATQPATPQPPQNGSSVPHRTASSIPLKKLRRQLKPYFPTDMRKRLRRTLLSPISPLPLGRYLYRRGMEKKLHKVWDREQPFDVMLLRTSQADLKLLRQLMERTNLPTVVDAGGPLAFQADHVFHRSMTRADRNNERFLYEKADAVIVISEAMKALLVKDGIAADKIVTIPNGVDFEKFRMAKVDTSLLRQKLGLGLHPIVGYVGGFWQGHDVTTLLKAWQRVQASSSAAVLLMVGDGPQRPQAQALSHQLGLQNVHWVGHVPHEDVPGYLSLMDVAVAPYIEAAASFVSPLKVIEYLAMGLPVVATSGGQLTELIEHGVSGYLYEPGSVAQLTEYAQTLLNAPEQAQRMGLAAQTRMRQWYSWDRVASETLSICQKVMS